jgi:hypothetical protein
MMKFYKLVGSIIELYTILILPPLVLAQSGVDFGQDPATFADIGGVIDSALSVIFPALFVTTTVMGITGAIMWILASGDPNRLKLAQGTLTWAVIGFIFTLISWTFAKYVLGIILVL